MEDLLELKENASANSPIFAHLKIDTGMGRMGVRFENAESIIQMLSETPETDSYTHLRAHET